MLGDYPLNDSLFPITVNLPLRELGRENQGVESALVDDDDLLNSTGGDHFVHPFILAIDMVADT